MSRYDTLTGSEASILTLVAESPSRYDLAELDESFGPLRDEVRDIAAVLIGVSDGSTAKPNRLRRSVSEIAEAFRVGVESARNHSRGYRGGTTTNAYEKARF
jgi:hypothetical protein